MEAWSPRTNSYNLYYLMTTVIGKWTGLVTTTRITHASPAAAYGHSPWRFWETDASIDANCQGKIDDLAKQLLVDNRYIRVSQNVIIS